jgi:hypothetical protein
MGLLAVGKGKERAGDGGENGGLAGSGFGLVGGGRGFYNPPPQKRLDEPADAVAAGWLRKRNMQRICGAVGDG